MFCTGTLLQESIITGIIISDVTMIMETDGGTNISGRKGMGQAGKVMAGTGPPTTTRADRVRVTGPDLSTTYRQDRKMGIGTTTGLFIVRLRDPTTVRGADPPRTTRADRIRVTGPGLSTTHRQDRTTGIGTDLRIMRLRDLTTVRGPDPPRTTRADRIRVTGPDLSTTYRQDRTTGIGTGLPPTHRALPGTAMQADK